MVHPFILKLRHLFYALIICSIGLLQTSCDNDESVDSLLQNVEKTIELDPEEALQVLGTIQDPESLSKELYLKYIVFYSLAQHMNKRPISEDETLIEASVYFRDKKSYKNAALANYLVGSRLQEKGSYVHSLRWFYDAARYSENIKLDRLTGKSLDRISYAYFEQGVYSEAARLCKQALSFFERTPGCEEDMLASLSIIGLWHYKTNELDCALIRYNEGLEVARRINDKESEARFKAFLGTVLGCKGETAKAVTYLDEAIQGVKNTEDSLLTYKGYLLTYNKIGNIVKAKPYADILSHRHNEIGMKSRQRETLHELSYYYESLGDMTTALKFGNMEAAMYFQMELEKSAEDFLTIKEEYDVSLKDMDLQNQRLWYLTLIVSILFATSAIAAIFYFRIRGARFKNEEQERENKMLEERVEHFEYLRSMYKSTIVRLVQMDKRVQGLIDESRQISNEVPVVYQEMQTLISSLRRNSGYHYVRIAEDYMLKQPNGEALSKVLDRPNKIIFMLCTLRYNQSEMASMVGMTRKSVMMRRYDIRNTMIKHGVPEKVANSIIFFESENGTDNQPEDGEQK